MDRFSHTVERVLQTQASLTFNQLKNTKLQFKQLSLMQNYLNIGREGGWVGGKTQVRP